MFFFFKQKTAYEMRISDWSSDVCSSDLDMKVSVEGDRLRAIGKTLDPSIVNGESIGFLRFNARGAELFLDEIERAMKSEQGLKQWYLSAIDRSEERRVGKSVSVRVDLGGSRIIKKKKVKNNKTKK